MFILLLLTIFCVYAVATFYGHHVPTPSQGIKADDWDLMDIAVIKNPKPKIQTVTSTQPKQPKFKEHPLYQDCVAVLVSLGAKKSEAVSSVKNIFAKNDIQSVEQFINIAFSN